MLLRTFQYELVRVDAVSLGKNEPFQFPSGGAGDAIGSIYNMGYLVPVGGEGGWSIAEHLDWRPRAAWGGWNSPENTDGAARFRGSPGDGAEWVCLSNYPEFQRDGVTPHALYRPGGAEVQPQTVISSFTLPAGWGFVLARGDVSIILPDRRQQVAPVENFVKPKLIDLEVVGSGVLLLVR